MEQRILVTGATGQLGPYVVAAIRQAGFRCAAWSGRRRVRFDEETEATPVPLEDARLVEQAWRSARPSAVVHLAALSRIDACYRDPARARSINVGGTDHLVRLARAQGIRFLYISTDLVFDGEKGNYTEEDHPHPVSVYGATKLQAEQVALAYPNAAVFRIALLYGPGRGGTRTFLDRVLESWRNGKAVKFFQDEWRSPLALPDAAAAIVHWLRSPRAGLFHVGGPERISRYEMGCRIARAVGIPVELCEPASRLDWESPEPRPRDVSLDSTRWRTACPLWQPEPLEQNVARFWGRIATNSPPQ